MIVNSGVILIILALLLSVLLVLLFMNPHKYIFLQEPFLAFAQKNMKKLGLGMSIIAQIGCIFLYPWYTLQRYVIKQVDLKKGPNDNCNQDADPPNY